MALPLHGCQSKDLHYRIWRLSSHYQGEQSGLVFHRGNGFLLGRDRVRLVQKYDRCDRRDHDLDCHDHFQIAGCLVAHAGGRPGLLCKWGGADVLQQVLQGTRPFLCWNHLIVHILVGQIVSYLSCGGKGWHYSAHACRCCERNRSLVWQCWRFLERQQEGHGGDHHKIRGLIEVPWKIRSNL